MEIINSFFELLHSNKIVSTMLSTFLVLYGGLAKPNLPKFVRNLFNDSIFKLVILSLVVYSSNKDPKFAILIALVFVISLNNVNTQENFGTSVSAPNFSEDCKENGVPLLDLPDIDIKSGNCMKEECKDEKTCECLNNCLNKKNPNDA